MPDKPIYADLGDLTEDERIVLIGRTVESGKLSTFVVEDDAKADRYIAKLQKSFRVQVVARGVGPIKDSVWVKVGPTSH